MSPSFSLKLLSAAVLEISNSLTYKGTSWLKILNHYDNNLQLVLHLLCVFLSLLTPDLCIERQVNNKKYHLNKVVLREEI